MLYYSWCVTDVIIFHFGPFFSVFPHNNLKNQNLKKLKKSLKISSFYTGAPKIMIICYTVPEIKHNKQSFLSFLAIFCPLTLLATWKSKVLKKWTKNLKILSFYTCIPQMMIIWCMVPETWSAIDRFFCHFGLFFAFLPH